MKRLQGTILHEHWRLEFRRRYSTHAALLEASLQHYLDFYSEQRPHSTATGPGAGRPPNSSKEQPDRRSKTVYAFTKLDDSELT